MSDSLWGQYQNPLAAVIPITQEVIRLDFPAGRYLAINPVTLVTVNGGVTDVTITSDKEAVSGYGEVHNHVEITFKPEAVGKFAHVWVMGP